MHVLTKSQTAVLLTFIMLAITGCKKEKCITLSGEKEHEYVDLGLPSGTLWATCNVGAHSPEESGDYFAWGETSTKDSYVWENYMYCNYHDDIVDLTKYNADDSLTVLEPGDDAARACWGADWRMATKEEWAELYQNTTWIWTKQNGVMGRLLTGSNGNSLFLPAVGYRVDGEPTSTGLGIYWTSTLTGIFISAYSYHFDFDQCHVCATYERCRGQVTRAVRCK